MHYLLKNDDCALALDLDLEQVQERPKPIIVELVLHFDVLMPALPIGDFVRAQENELYARTEIPDVAINFATDRVTKLKIASHEI